MSASQIATGSDKPETSYQHWQVERDRDNIVWLSIDRDGESTNTLGEAVIEELGSILDELGSSLPEGLVLQSAKKSGFIAGADIREFGHFTDPAEVTTKVREAHAVFAKLESLSCPTVASVEGFCLGGGLELALCCQYIIARDRDDTRIGLPEVNLGIYPGFGGTVRLTERVGGLQGIQLMLTGRMLRAKAARSMGVIDQVIGEHDSLHWHARKAILQKRKSRGPGLLAKASNSGIVRGVLANFMVKKTAEKANPEHYPAPFKLIDNWRQNRGNRKAMFDAEAVGIGELMVGDTATNLRRVFNLMEHLKSLGKETEYQVLRVHVIGAGVMGGDIAAWCVVQGMEVTLQDRELKYIEPALSRAKKLFRRKLKTKAATGAAMARLIADVDGNGVARADVIIEAIFEDPTAKQELYTSLERHMKADAILASNTSAIPIETLASVLKKPERFIGLHFFNPVAKMPLVEVVRGEQSNDLSVQRGAAFCGQINRFPLPVKSSPGFLVNRVLAPYLMEAMRCYTEGIDKQTIDAAAKMFGMPMGPVELADIVGLDVCIKVAETLSGTDVEKERNLLESMIGQGKLGKKSGEGFYVWEKGKPRRDKSSGSKGELLALSERLLKPFLDECVSCRDDQIVKDEDLLDAGIIFGTGFAPFRGGPMHYLNCLDKGEKGT